MFGCVRISQGAGSVTWDKARKERSLGKSGGRLAARSLQPMLLLIRFNSLFAFFFFALFPPSRTLDSNVTEWRAK